MIGQNLNANTQTSKAPPLLGCTRARVTSFLGRVTRGALLSVGALTVAGVAGAGLLSQQAANQGLQLPQDFVLVMNFDGTKLVEKADPTAKLWAEGKQIQLSKVVDALYRAGADKRVQGIVACFGDAQQYIALAQVQELRNAVLDFRQAKADSVPTVAYSDSFGEAGGNGTVPYYLASAFDQIYIHDTGMLSLTGFAASQPFLRGLLDKWHIKPLAFAREEYKSAASLLTDKAYSKANREATKAWLNSWMGQIVQDVAAARGLKDQDVCKALNASPLSVHEAAAAGLITAPGHRSAVTQTLLHSSTSAADPATLVGRQVAKLANAQPAEMSKLGAAESSELETGQRAVSAANQSESTRTSAPDSPAQPSGKSSVTLGTLQPVLHSAAEQHSPQMSASSAAQSSEASARRKSLQLAAPLQQASEAPSASEHQSIQSSVSQGTAQHGDMTKVQRLQAVRKPVNTAMVVQITPDRLHTRCCRAVPIGKYIQEHDRKQGQKQDSLMQTVWAAVSGADTKEETVPPAKSADPCTAKPQIAVITASGQILAGSAPSSLKRQTEIRSTELGLELQKARHDPKVKAVVLRVDSPGGSAVASDAIYQDLVKVQQAGKPVVVSIGNLAASGGYYISAGANKIVAQPGTITGSIGVVFGKLDVSQALRDQGISVDTIAVGRNATASSPFHDFTREQQRQVNAMIDRTYVQFLSRVAVGRNMSIQEVRKVARGRIWTGEDALHHGLVDKLGGLKDAVHLAKQEAGLSQEDDAVKVVDFPPAKSVFQLVKEALGEQPISFAAAALLASSMQAQNDSTALPFWWPVLARQLGLDNVSSQPLAADVFTSSSGAQLLQQGSLATIVNVQQQSGLQMLCDPVTVR